jgi:hypothetical protein
MAEALLTSSVLAHFDRGHNPRPLNLVRTLGITPGRLAGIVKSKDWRTTP